MGDTELPAALAAGLDEIEVTGIERTARHGVYDDERRDGRVFRVDVRVAISPTLRAFASDRIGDTVNYERLAEVVDGVLGGPPHHLVEHLAEAIAEGCLRLTSVQRCEVRVRKRAPGVAGNPEWVGVRIARPRR